MLNALAPRLLRVSLGLVLLAGTASWAHAQAPKADDAAAKKDAAAPAQAEEAPAEGEPDESAVVDAATARKLEPVETFKDPRVEPLLENTFPEFRRPNPPLQVSRIAGRPDDISRVRAMASGTGQVDPNLLQRYVDHFAAELTSHANIKALLETPEEVTNLARASQQARAISDAVDSLISPILIARESKAAVFLSNYTTAVLRTMPKLLNNHLIPRMQAMIVIGSTGSQDALDVYIEQLNSADQVIWVKHWAAMGLTGATETGKVELRDVQKGIVASTALVNFLERETDAPWPTKLRVLEALGSLRQASIPLQNRASIAAAVARVLADPASKTDIRAWASWAMGMFRVGAAVQNYNYALVAYLIGQTAADIGEEIVKVHADNPAQAQYLASLLLYQIFPAFEGVEGVRESGLLVSPGVPITDKTKIQGLFSQIRGVGAAATQLTQASSSQAEERRAQVAAKVADLRAFLAKNKPQSVSLVPGDPPLIEADPKVAETPTTR